MREFEQILQLETVRQTPQKRLMYTQIKTTQKVKENEYDQWKQKIAH